MWFLSHSLRCFECPRRGRAFPVRYLSVPEVVCACVRVCVGALLTHCKYDDCNTTHHHNINKLLKQYDSSSINNNILS